MPSIAGKKTPDWAVELCVAHRKALACGLCIFLAIIMLLESRLSSSSSSASTSERKMDCDRDYAPFRTEPPYPRHQPVWISSYPSYMDHFLGPFIDSLTGHEGSVVNLYQSQGKESSRLTDCYNDPKVVTCMTSYPLLDVMTSPTTLQDEFNRAYIMALQNPFRAIYILAATEYIRNNHIPLYSNNHTLSLTLPREKWVRYRDKHFLDALEDWTRMIDTWKALPFYRKSYYAVYEHLIDAQLGPAEANKVAYVLQRAGNDVSSVMDNQCLWQASEAAWHEPLSSKVFVYTATQRDVMIQHLQDFMCSHASDTALVSILELYIREMQVDLVVEP